MQSSLYCYLPWSCHPPVLVHRGTQCEQSLLSTQKVKALKKLKSEIGET